MESDLDCPACKGTGQWFDHSNGLCDDCRGTGRIIPPGYSDGEYADPTKPVTEQAEDDVEF
jgi:hypothetical protein